MNQCCSRCSGLLQSRPVMGLALVLTAAAAAFLSTPGTVSHAQSKEDPAAGPQGSDQVTLAQRTNQALRLIASEVVALNVDTTPEVPVTVAISLDGVARTLTMAPYTVQAPGYRVHAQVEDGSLVEVEPGPMRTLRGGL